MHTSLLPNPELELPEGGWSVPHANTVYISHQGPSRLRDVRRTPCNISVTFSDPSEAGRMGGPLNAVLSTSTRIVIAYRVQFLNLCECGDDQ